MKASQALALTKEAYDASSAFVDANYRKDWDYSIKAFRNEHAAGSKYLADEYKARSRIFRPKTRSIIRKNEAAAMQAMFANREFCYTEAQDPDNLESVAAAACMKELLQYRMTRSIPTFEIYLGGVQDAQTQGAVVSYQYWDYQKRGDKVLKDKPCIELRPIENIRIDGAASWVDPIGTSPYFCDIVPMYVCDVKGMMASKDEKTGAPKWKKLSDEEIAQARPDAMDSTRKARLGNQQDPQEETSGIKMFDIVWVMRWFMRNSIGEDFVYYTMGTEHMLTDPRPIDDVYFHGVRPYAMGFAILETHTMMKTSMPTLIRPLQAESNQLANSRIDNVQFVLNKRWIVARGRQVDVQSLVRNVPGGVTLATDPNLDVKESNWPDVTSSAYVEQDRLNSDMDDLAGNFSPATKVANNAVNDTLGGSRLAAAGAGLMTEYLLRTVNETWWEKVVRQVALLEQYYETDSVVMGVCAQKARLFPRFGMSRITDEMLMNEVIVTVDVSMGDPAQRMQKFLMATNAAVQLRMQAPPGANVSEMTKEIYSNAGYRDGARFWNDREDPKLMRAMQMVQQLQGMVQGKQMELQADAQVEAAKLQSNERIKAAEIQVNQQRIQGDLQIRSAELAIEQEKLAIEKMRIQLDAEIAAMNAQNEKEERPYRIAELQSSLENAQMKLDGERQKLVGLAMKIAAESEKAQAELALIGDSRDKERTITAVSQGVNSTMQELAAQIEQIKAGIEGTTAGLKDQVANLQSGLSSGISMMAQVATAPKRKPKGFALLKGDDQKTRAIAVDYDDGTREEMPVM